MRSIRRAAIAGATAASLILGAASAATAEEAQKDDKSFTTKVKDTLSSKERKNDSVKTKLKHLSTDLADELEADKPTTADRIFGNSSEASKEPKWARYMKITTIVGLIGSFLGLVVFPGYNFLVANHMLPGMPPR